MLLNELQEQHGTIQAQSDPVTRRTGSPRGRHIFHSTAYDSYALIDSVPSKQLEAR
jgi:hypothetical protein